MKFDVIVVGGGHAGIEAAYICAKRAIPVLLITTHLDMIGQMSCNPAIGGIAKGNIVREIDALGGLMGQIIDRAGIHFKMLNQTKGMAVWGNRAQADKLLYRKFVRQNLEMCEHLHILQANVEKINVRHGKVHSVILNNGQHIETGALILCMGTFLNGIAHIGLHSFPCGRLGEPSSLNLTESIIDLGITSGRLKTGTSPRIDGRTVNFEKMTKQMGDDHPWPFSYSSDFHPKNLTNCWITKTTNETHAVIRENLDKSPLYTGKIKSIGPRYCPSIEDKVVRFGDRGGHTLFLEPEGLDIFEMYLNGLSTSLPFDIQTRMVQSVPGLENAKVLRPGYAIEYDYFQPIQLKPSLESKTVKNLFFAGQINGTSGYEEAGCQGLIAGINAVASITDQDFLILSRDSSYTGILIDDLITKGTEEPYRMFTSRAEHRLTLRQDTADERLMPLAYLRGLIGKELYEKRKHFWNKKNMIKEKIGVIKVEPAVWNTYNKESSIKEKAVLKDLLKRPEISLSHIEMFLEEKITDDTMKLSIEADIKYSGFIEKEMDTIERYKKMETSLLPDTVNYSLISGLLNETKIKLEKVKPRSLGQAARIPGVTPADISVLMVYLIKNKHVSRGTVDL